MSPPDQDKCSECGESLPSVDLRPAGTPKTPCPRCGSTKRIKSGSVHMEASVNISADAKLIIGWQEVDRLLTKTEFAAALLVAAVNVEFILWENLRRFSPASPPSEKTHYSEWKAWHAITKGDRDSVGLGSLIQTAGFFVASQQLALTPPLKPIGWPLNEARKGIAHERGYFAKLTQLKNSNWPETRIRQVLEEAKTFCHGNAP